MAARVDAGGRWEELARAGTGNGAEAGGSGDSAGAAATSGSVGGDLQGSSDGCHEGWAVALCREGIEGEEEGRMCFFEQEGEVMCASCLRAQIGCLLEPQGKRKEVQEQELETQPHKVEPAT
ncbi:hypothetical protein TRIUR3_27952 [Triticum urartu]|uniref:Uncharacterized protein n=1 Tax=Triticum urartu TaxID=4572 RepID=M8A4W8_TRIUA|nr:hypothetical protein TRIUR3_27952 [Triticum urartu]